MQFLPPAARFLARSPACPAQLASLSMSLVTALALAAVSPAVWAEKTDKKKPINAEADSMRYDDLKQTSVFTGNVVITKGTITIRGAKVDVRQDPEGFQFGTAAGSAAQRAFYRQKRDVPEEWIEGEAETIFYDSKADTVTFTKNAVLRRYRGATVSDETSGNVITYDNTTDVFSVVGGSANASASNPTGRVRTMLTPKDSSAPASAPSPAPAPIPTPALAPKPAGAASGPATTLRPSTNLSGTGK